MNHVLRRPYYTPASPVEQSRPVYCPLVSLEPADNLGCSCPALVSIVTIIRCTAQVKFSWTLAQTSNLTSRFIIWSLSFNTFCALDIRGLNARWTWTCFVFGFFESFWQWGSNLSANRQCLHKEKLPTKYLRHSLSPIIYCFHHYGFLQWTWRYACLVDICCVYNSSQGTRNKTKVQMCNT